jgi:hypothetical protein
VSTGTTRLDAAQLAEHWRHSPRAVLRTATELAYAAGHGRAQDWSTFLTAWCELHNTTPEAAAYELQELVYQYCDKDGRL